MATPYTRSPRRDDEWQQEHRQSMTVRRSLGLLLALRRGHEAERNGLHTHRKNTHQMHWSAYAQRISTSIRCNAVAQPPQAHRSSGSRKLQKIRLAAGTSKPTGLCGHGNERGSAKMRAHRMGDAGARERAEKNTFVAHASATQPRPAAKRSVAHGRRVCSLERFVL